MSAIVGSSALAAASTNARGLGFKTSAPMGAKVAATTPASRRATSRGSLRVVAGNDYEGGLFAPIVVVARDVIGVKRFNQIRCKAIALHSQVSARGASIPRPPFRPQSFLVWLDNKPDRVASSRRADVFDPSCFSSGYHRILQGDRRGRQGSPDPDSHREAERREARLPRVSARLEDCFSAEKESLPDRKRKEGVDGILLTRASPGEASHAGTERRTVAYRERERAAAREERSN